tara:strand:- start:111 stop:623 length:513 start_codon:yes stop_codon:yes gene_type:complete
MGSTVQLPVILKNAIVTVVLVMIVVQTDNPKDGRWNWWGSDDDSDNGRWNWYGSDSTGDEVKTQSAKAKGRRLQQWFRDLLIEKLDIHPEDIESRSMGAGGEDLIMARAAREKFPYSIECKNQESVNLWKSYDQAKENSKDYEPVVVLKRNNSKPLVLVDAEYFVKLHEK